MPLGAHKAAIMGVSGVSTGDVVLIQSQTASDSATVSFTSGITSTYGEYIFKFYNIRARTDRGNFEFQVNASGESGYNETITSCLFRSYHDEADAEVYVQYLATEDQAQGTAFDRLVGDVGSGADECAAGELHLFSPSSTTYVTHFTSDAQVNAGGDYLHHAYSAGYVNVTAAITDVQFKMHSGNFDGTIKLWGVKN